MIIARLVKGVFWGGNDEVGVIPDPDFEDATKVRQGNWLRPILGWLGAHSWNIFEGDKNDPRQYEKALDGVRHNDDRPKREETFEYVWMLQPPGRRGDMGREQEVMRITHEYLEVFGQKIAWNNRTVDAIRQGIIELYVALLGRHPESEAVIEEWRRVSGGDLDTVRQGIMGSPEYQGRQS